MDGPGLSACPDLALALVVDDHGQDVALRVARQLVIYLKRPGGQSQFNVSLDQVSTVMGQAVVRNRASGPISVVTVLDPASAQAAVRMALAIVGRWHCGTAVPESVPG